VSALDDAGRAALEDALQADREAAARELTELDREAVERDALTMHGWSADGEGHDQADYDPADGLDDRELLELVYRRQLAISAQQERITATLDAFAQAIAPFVQMAQSGANPMAMLGAMMKGGR